MSVDAIAKTQEKKEMTSGSFYISQEAYNMLVKIANDEKRSISKQIEYIVEEYCKIREQNS